MDNQTYRGAIRDDPGAGGSRPRDAPSSPAPDPVPTDTVGDTLAATRTDPRSAVHDADSHDLIRVQGP